MRLTSSPAVCPTKLVPAPIVAVNKDSVALSPPIKPAVVPPAIVPSVEPTSVPTDGETVLATSPPTTLPTPEATPVLSASSTDFPVSNPEVVPTMAGTAPGILVTDVGKVVFNTPGSAETPADITPDFTTSPKSPPLPAVCKDFKEPYKTGPAPGITAAAISGRNGTPAKVFAIPVAILPSLPNLDFPGVMVTSVGVPLLSR